ncbi:hypothetical protein KAR91_50120 [Candidatus Pacearchaeota archaeon]|nr:hypothetical protein [Candidatus Pacearchaeota archaeon]
MAKKGTWSDEEKNLLITNYLLLTDEEMAKRLGRTRTSVSKMRTRMKLSKTDEPAPDIKGQHRGSYVSALSEGDKRTFLMAEMRRTAQYKQTKGILRTDEMEFYEERYIEFMMDPTIETMTSAEKDTLHRKTLTEIRLHRFLQEEKRAIDEFADFDGEDDDDNEREERRKYIANKSREIDSCNQVIKECEKSLNVTREQRLKNSNDQAVNFTTLIKDMQNPALRAEIGYEAAMFRWMARKDANEKTGEHILSGRDEQYSLGKEFKSGVEPEGVSNDFTGEEK